MKKLFGSLIFCSLLFSCKKDTSEVYNLQDVSINANINLFKIEMIDENVGYVVGSLEPENTFLRTSCKDGQFEIDNTIISLDGSKTYTKDCSLIDSVSTLPYMFKTINGGTSWEPVKLPFTKFKSMSFVDKNSGYVLADDGLYKTIDGGLSWMKVLENKVIMSSNLKLNAFNEIKFVSPNYGFLFGDNYGVAYDDSVKKYESEMQMYSIIKDIITVQTHKDTCFLLTVIGLFTSSNNGKNWKITNKDVDFFSFDMIDNIFGYAVTEWPLVLQKTLNSGKSWENVTNLNIIGTVVKKIKCFGLKTIFISSDFEIIVSEDSGNTFSKIKSPNTRINDVCFPSKNVAYAISFNGKIIKYIKK